jgi:translocation and assembly module TamB
LSEDLELEEALAAEPEPVVTRKRVVEAVVIAALLAVLAIGLAGRFGVLTPLGRALIASPLQALSLGRLGALKVEGIGGDVWRDFTIRRLTISDAKGVWLDARAVRVRWKALELFRRRVHAEQITATTVTLLRSPELGPAGPPTRAPASVIVDHLALELDTDPAFSVETGRFDVTGNFDAERGGALTGAMAAKSKLHDGDGASARFTVGGKAVAIDAHAVESGGGALAGSAGLPSKQAFRLDLRAVGQADHGLVYLRAASGARSIAEADGTWTKAGGSARGHIVLGASARTAGYTKMLGPELNFSIAGAGRGAGLYDLNVQGDTDNADLRAKGTVDGSTLSSTSGLAVQAQVKDLGRFLGNPLQGRGAFDGVWIGKPDAWRAKGRLTTQGLSHWGYTLAQTQGPATLDYNRHELKIAATIDGAGGSGQGFVPAVAGPRPHGEIEATRLVDGRILVRSVKLDGDGLKLQGEGQRGLLGGLDFKGALQVSNLAAAKVGAKGTADARWTLFQGKWGEPWKLSVDAKGAGFATGFAVLDHMLGPKPTIRATGALGAPGLSIARADVAGASSTINGSGLLSGDGALKFGFKWTAEGPIDVGPLAVGGRANGTGALTGTLGAPRMDLAADLERIDAPGLVLKPAHLALAFGRTAGQGRDLDGTIEVTASSDYGPAHVRAAFRYAADGLDLTGLDAAGGGASAAGSISLRKSTPSAADLTIAAGPGAFLTQGRLDGRVHIADATGGPSGTASLTASNLALRSVALSLTSAHLDAKGPIDRMAYKLSADGVAAGVPMKVAGSGVGGLVGQGWQASFEGAGRVRRADFHTLSPAQFSFNGPSHSAKADISLGGGKAVLDAQETAQAVKGRLTFSGVDLGALGEDLAGRFNADLTVGGQGQHLDGVLDARLQGARSRDAPSNLAMDGTIHAVLAGPKLTVDAAGTGAVPGDHAKLNVVLPAVATAAPFRIAIDRTKPVNGRFDADGELAPIWDLFFGGERSLGGRLSTAGTIAGTLNAPRFEGRMAIANGRFEDAATGLKLRNLSADVDLRDNLLSVKRFSAQDSKSGSLSGEGQASFANGGSSTLTLTAHGFQLLDNETAKATASGVVTVVQGADGKAKLSGRLTIDRADISTEIAQTPPGVTAMDVIERNKPVSDRDVFQPFAGRGPVAGLDIHISAPRRIFVKGLGLTSEMSLEAQVSGDTAQPILQGEAHMVRGDYDMAGKRFTIDDSSVVYLATTAARMRLDLSASREDPSLTAVIHIKGTAAKPEVTLTSTPTLPSDEVLSQVLFGRSASQLSPVEAAQLAAAVTSLATGGGFDVMGGLRNFARLDRLALAGGDAATGVSVSGGKYISNNVYLELTGGGRQGPSAQVEVRANKAFSFISQLGGETGAKLEVRWKIDYGKPKAPKPKP